MLIVMAVIENTRLDGSRNFPRDMLGKFERITQREPCPLSSLIVHAEENLVLVATDTLATRLDGRPYKFTSKAFIVPHLRMIMAGTGTAGFLDRWFILVNNGMIVWDIDDADQATPAGLVFAWTKYKQELSEAASKPIDDSLTTTVYHFGFSKADGSIHSFRYSSTNNFKSEPYPHARIVRPPCSMPDNQGPLKDSEIRTMMDEQRAIERSKPPNEKRICIGGEIQIHQLSKDGFNVRTAGRFDDYDYDERAIYENLGTTE
jgi:hypothetical protein